MKLIDSHCHLHFDKFAEDISEVVQRAKDNGVTKMITVGCSLDDSAKAVKFANSQESVWASAGAHPHDGVDYSKDKSSDDILSKLLAQTKVVAVGEIGLDYFHENAPRQVQQEILHAQIKVGLAANLPFIFHVRDAWDDFWEIFDCYCDIRGVVHSFSSDKKQLDQALSRGLHIGLNGIMTFTKDADQIEAAKLVPLNRLLLETDAPFLSPPPHRGKRCEPAYVKNVVEFLVELRQEDPDNLAAAATNNTEKLFSI